LKLAIENTDAGLWDWNISTGEVYFSDIWCKMLGYDKSEVEPNVKSWEKLVHPDDMPFINMVLTQHLEGKTDDYQTIHRLLTKSGKWKWVMDKGKVIEYDGDGRPTRAIGTHIDMDYQKKIEDELRKANTTKDKFFSIIAHDMLGPLGTLVKVTELISQKGMMSPEKMYSFLDNVKALTKNIFDLLTDLLSWAKINQEKVDFHPKNLNLNKIIKHNVDEIQLLANGKGITIMIKDAESFIVFADENMVDLVLRNLISNSVKFTKPDGEIVIEIVNDVSYDKQKIQFAKVRILDSGVGILPEDIQKILSDDIFYSTFGTKNEKGTGLGLKLCKEFIKTNGGVFNIESKINLGTICSFTLPLTEIQTN
jgi:PAS domain S-box-containing protein